MDGHAAIENRQVSSGGSGDFQAILSYLKDDKGNGLFIVHVSSRVHYSHGFQPTEFLPSLGLTPHRGRCQFLEDGCHWWRLARHDAGEEWHRNPMSHFRQNHAVHEGFKEFASKLGDIFKMRQREAELLSGVNLRAKRLPIVAAPVELETVAEDVPQWVDAAKFPQLIELERERSSLEGRIDDLARFLPLLFGTGPQLERAVIESLRFLDLKADKTPDGFTADILARTSDERLHFGFEVTGLSGAIMKSSKKLTQVLEFERVKEHSEKTILLANTHNAIPLDERAHLEHFTQPVIDYVGRHPILMMTGEDLYNAIAQALNGRSKLEIVELLYATTGVLKFPGH